MPGMWAPDDATLHQLLSAFGEFAKPSVEALKLALDRAEEQHKAGRIPIAAAAVSLLAGERHDSFFPSAVVAVGHNGRIPPAGTSEQGYPTDHGETACVRAVGDVAGVDWARVVFATTLAPCIMCTRTLEHLHGLGLRRVVVAEASSFQGGIDRLRALPGMVVVTLKEQRAIGPMQDFARRYPWDWEADIGGIPPRHAARDALTGAGSRERLAGLLNAVAAKRASAARSGFFSADSAAVAAAVVALPDGEVRDAYIGGEGGVGPRGNPALSAIMVAMGRAGSAVNLRECALVTAWGDAVAPGAAAGEEGPPTKRGRCAPVSVRGFGLSSLGACELFRPAAVLSDAPFDDDLRSTLEAACIRVLAPCMPSSGGPGQ